MSQEFFAPMLDNEILLYAVLHNNTGAFLFAKIGFTELLC